MCINIKHENYNLELSAGASVGSANINNKLWRYYTAKNDQIVAILM